VNLIAVLQLAGRDSSAVHDGPIAAVEISAEVTRTGVSDLEVLARSGRISDNERTLTASTYSQSVSDGDSTPISVVFGHDEGSLGHLAPIQGSLMTLARTSRGCKTLRPPAARKSGLQPDPERPTPSQPCGRRVV
jgi:hypothetical protein